MSVLMDKISEKYVKIRRRRGIRENNSGSENEEERAFFTKAFKGRYRKCRKFGHKAHDWKSDIQKRPWAIRRKNGGGG